ncbi:hypothetical protein II906_06180, partial [bacterium]|nr:hypothetical protein [bacterium]
QEVDRRRRQIHSEMLLDILEDFSQHKSGKSSLSTTSDKKILHIFIEEITGGELSLNEFKNRGIDTGRQLIKLLGNYSQVKDIFKGSEYEFLKIYTSLDDDKKSDIVKWGEPLLSIYQRNEDDYDIASDNMRNFLDTMNFFKLQKFEKFDSKFGFLRQDFSNFLSADDRVDAYEFIYPKLPEIKAFLLSGVLPEGSSEKDANDFMINNLDAAYYLYNNSDNVDIVSIAPYINHKFSSGQTEKIKSEFHGFLEYSDKIDFYNFLHKYNISPENYKYYSSSFGFSDEVKILDKIKNSEFLISHLKLNDELSKDNVAENFYLNYCDLINHAYSYDSLYAVDKMTAFIQKFDLTSDQLYSLYLKTAMPKNKNFDTAKFMEFVDSSIYLPDNKLADVKKKKQIPKDIYLGLLKSKAYFEKIKPEIIEYIQHDETGFFIGQSPLSIFNKYYESLLKSKNISETLSAISVFNINADKNYNEKLSKLMEFSPFFTDNKSVANFITNAGINLDSDSEIENEHRLSCLTILKALKNSNNDDDKYNEIISRLSASKFLQNSKGSLNDFLEASFSKNLASNIETILDKKVPSIPILYSDISPYYKTSYGVNDYLGHLSKLPKGISYSDDINQLSDLQNLIQEYGFKFKLSSENIAGINYAEAQNVLDNHKKDADYFDINFINKLFPTSKHKNILSHFPNTFKRYLPKITKYKIASEILDNMNKSDESYSNICKLLNITNEKYPARDTVDKRNLASNIPDNFFNFVSKHNWLDYTNDGKTIPNIPLHARLRIIDRFALRNVEDIGELYKAKTEKKIKSLLNAVYAEKPDKVEANRRQSRYRFYIQHDDMPIKTVFAKDGTMITFMDIFN